MQRRSSSPSRSLPRPPPVVISQPQAGFGQMIKEGFGVGVGVSLAQRAVGAVLGPPKVEMAMAGPCKNMTALRDEYVECLRIYQRPTACDKQLDAMNSCISGK